MPPRTSTRKKPTVENPRTNGQGAPKTAISTVKTESKRAASGVKRKTGEGSDNADHEHEHEHTHADDGDESEEEDQKPAKKRKTKAKEKATSGTADMASLAERTVVGTLKKAMYIGAHVSASGGVHNSVSNALEIGSNAFALFLKSQRKWTSPPLAPDVRDLFRDHTAKHSYSAAKHVLPHGSYLVNLAQADPEKAKQAYDNFVDDLNRCDELGIGLYNFHPGSTGGAPMSEACARIAKQLNRAHKETKSVITVLENMAGSGNVVGSKFEELRDIIALVEDKSRVGVCIDTCHTFAAGYDLRSPEAFSLTMREFDKIVGLEYLKALHLNDSKAPLNSNRDLHANIGTGFLGLRAFHNVMNYTPFENLPMVLETPIDRKNAAGKTVEDKQVWANEIKLLEGLIGADVDSKEFQEREAELQVEGEGERRRVQEQVDKKGKKAAPKAKGKGK